MYRDVGFVKVGRRSCLAVLALALVLPVWGANYYVAIIGDNTANGSSEAPFKTIQKAASVMVAGDTCYVKAGIYRETVTPASSGTAAAPIVFCALGADSVVISGADPVAGPWPVSSGKIYVTDAQLSGAYNRTMATNTTLLANQIFVNGEMQPQCRWPNLSRANAADPNFTYNVAIPANVPGGLTGAIAWESSWFETHTGTIANAAGTSITWEKALCDARDDHRRWVVGAMGLLDTAREWHYDTAAKKLYLWAPDGGVPANVEAKSRNFAFDLRGKSYITVRSVNIFASTIITNTQSSHILIDRINARYVSHYVTLPIMNIPYSDNCDEIAAHTDDSGIMLYGPYCMIINSKIQGSAGNGVLTAGHHNVVYNCLIRDCDYMGTYASPVHVLDDSVRILHNSISGTGRDGISWDHHRAAAGRKGHWYGSDLGFNYIGFFSQLMSDDGSIYVCCTIDMTSTQVHHTNTHDMSTRAPGPFGYGAGVYFDQNTFGWCVYQNIGNPGGENIGGGSPGPCPPNISQAWPVPAGCNMPDCGPALGKTLPQYPGIPASPDPVSVVTEPYRGAAPVHSGLALDAVVTVYDMNGAQVLSCKASAGTISERLRLSSGMYCARVQSNGVVRACRFVAPGGAAGDVARLLEQR